MCTLAIYFRAARDYPIVIAANRDEFLDRPSSAPTLLSENPRVIGGKDLRAGGTWLGVNRDGLVAGLLNRRPSGPAPADPRSRGLLCLDALRCRDAVEAHRMITGESAADYNPFNLLMASPEAAYVAYNRAGTIETVELAPGLHLLTNLDVDDFECPRISHAWERFARLGAGEQFVSDPVSMRDRIAALLGDHRTQLDPRNGRPNALCLHLDGYGTRSSSLIFLRRDGRIDYFFASGPPCRTSYRQVQFEPGGAR